MTMIFLLYVIQYIQDLDQYDNESILKEKNFIAFLN